MSNEDKCDSKPDTPSENKCSLLQKLFSPTIRLTISLREPDEEFCSVFNYISLISEEKRNRRSEREKIGGKQNVDESEEVDDEVKKLAAHFEEKYGNGTSKKKKKKKVTTFYNYTELASGYDESDSFIDNSEAFDEALPDEMETFHGGYYVNCGQLEFKKVETVEENSEAEELRVAKKKTNLLRSDDSNDDDDFTKSDSSSAESETEDVVNEAKKLPEDNDQKAVECESTKNTVVPLPKNQDKVLTDKSDPNSTTALTNGDLTLKKRKKYKKRRTTEDAEVVPKKKGRTVKTLLEEKRVLDHDENVSCFVGKSVENYYNSINDVIESVVNAARNRLEDSRDSSSSCSETKSIDSRTSCETEKENHVEEMDVVEPVINDSAVSNITKELIKLPENLPQDIIIMVNQLKAVALNPESGARTFFNTPNNCKLLSKLDEKTRSLASPSRLAVYTYLASFLPCSKDTLMKRARQFLIEEEEKKIGDLLNKLKLCIDKVMPSLFEKYSLAYVSAEENINGASKNNQFEENNSSHRLPSKTFVWTDEIRNHVHELAMCRIRCLNLLKPKKESVDELVKKFLDTRVKPLWPSGWMDTSTLMAEARIKTVSSTSKKAPRTNNASASAKKLQLPVPSSNNLSPPSVSVSSTAYNLLTNSLALQSLSMQYSSQPDSIYSAAAGSTPNSIPYRPDLSLISSTSTGASTLPFSMEVLSRLTGSSAASQVYPITSTTTITTATNANPYSKSVSSTKKQTTSLSSAPSSTSLHRTSTSVASSVAGLAATSNPATVSTESRKSAEPGSSKLNEMFKIDSLIGASAQLKKEHHQLNHVSQYNKHYSHKVEKKKMANEKRDNNYISSKSPVNLLLNTSNVYSSNKTNSSKNHNNHGHATVHPKNVGIASGASVISSSGGKRKQGNSNCNGVNICSSDLAEITATDLVLDLSPNKIIKNDKKSDVMAARMDHHLNYKNESNTKLAASANATAKDHNYWSSVKEESDAKEEKCDPIVCSGVPSLDNFKKQNGTAKPVSRKHRILQSGNQEAAGSLFKDGSAKPQISILPNHVQNELSVNVVPSKTLDDRRGRSSPAIREEKRTSLLEGKQSVDEKKRRSPLPGREEKRSALPKDLKITETTTATDILSKIINDSLQEGSDHSRRSPYVNSTYDSLERKLDRDSREKEKNYEAEIRLLPSLKESQPRPPEKAFVVPSSVERKQPSPSDRISGQKPNVHAMRDLSVVLHRSRISGDHRSDKKADRDARDKERSQNCDSEISAHFTSKESHRHHADKKVSSASADRKVACRASNEDVINELMRLNKLGGHSIPRRMEQIDPAFNMYNSNANELNGTGSEALNQSSPSSSSKPRINHSPFQDEFRKHIFKSDTGFMSPQ